MSATVHLIPGLNAVADDFAAAVVAFGSKLMDGALEAVEIVGLPLVNHFDSLVVFVAANFTFHTPHFAGSVKNGCTLMMRASRRHPTL